MLGGQVPGYTSNGVTHGREGLLKQVETVIGTRQVQRGNEPQVVIWPDNAGATKSEAGVPTNAEDMPAMNDECSWEVRAA